MIHWSFFLGLKGFGWARDVMEEVFDDIIVFLEEVNDVKDPIEGVGVDGEVLFSYIFSGVLLI